jgi:radical SAM enzyme (TIGR01210 family)
MTRTPAQVEWIPGRVEGRPGFRLMVILAAPGCAYYHNAGGCTNCGFVQSFGTGKPVSTEDYLAQLEAALANIRVHVDGPIEVDLYNSGSFFNPDEVPEAAQTGLLELAAARPEVSALLVESRPEYVTAERLRRAREACRGKPLEVGIGLESANAEILSRRIRKGFTWEQFAASARLVAAAGARLLVYVLLKPIDTGEREAIEDSVNTASTVFALGRELNVPVRVALEPCFVAPQTLLYRAFAEGRYRPPWLWSVAEVVTRVSPLGPVLVGLSDEGMNPRQAAHNCEKCTSRVRQALAAFNLTQDCLPLKALTCPCRNEWSEPVT